MTPEERTKRIMDCINYYGANGFADGERLLDDAIINAIREASNVSLENAAKFVEENYEEPMINIVGNPSWRERGPKKLAAAIRALKDRP